MTSVGIIMGSTSDWDTMRHAAQTLDALDVAYETQVVSAHRTPQRLYDYAQGAADRGIKVVIAGAGGAAHLPGMDSLLSIVQMPGGIPVGTLAIGKAGAINAGLLAAAILALSDEALTLRLKAWRAAQTQAVATDPAA